MPDESTTPTTTLERRKVWLEQRKTCITATDVAKIMGVSKYGGPIDVYLEKIGEAPETEPTEAMRRGLQLEPSILRIYNEEIAPLIPEQPFTLAFAPEHPRIGATLDARRERITRVTASPEALGECDGRPVDAKNVWRDSTEWGETGTDQMPVHFGTQLMIQMLVTGAEYADLAVLFSGNDFRHYTIERIPEVEANLIGICENFWRDHVEQRVPPSVDGTTGYSEYLARIFAKHSDVILRADSVQHEAAMKLHVAEEQFDMAESEKKLCQNVLKAAIGDARGIEGPKWRALWSLAKDSTGTDWEAVSKALALKHAITTGEAATKLLADLVKENQIVTKKGSRRFTFNYSQE